MTLRQEIETGADRVLRKWLGDPAAPADEFKTEAEEIALLAIEAFSCLVREEAERAVRRGGALSDRRLLYELEKRP